MSRFMYDENTALLFYNHFSNIMRFLPIVLVFLNFLACLILNMTTLIVYDEEDDAMKVRFKKNTWLYQLSESGERSNNLLQFVLINHCSRPKIYGRTGTGVLCNFLLDYTNMFGYWFWRHCCHTAK